MGTHHIKKQLRGLRTITPNPSWQAARRDLLLEQVRAQVGREVVPMTVRERFQDAFQSVVIGVESIIAASMARGATVSVLAVVLLLGSGGYVVSAAESSLPGQSLYGVKTAVEEFRLKIANDPRERVALEIEFAERRLDELTRISKESAGSPHVLTLVSQFEARVSNVASAVDTLTRERSAEGAMVAKLVDERIVGYEHVLTEAAAGADRGVSKNIDRAKVAVVKAETKALIAILDEGSAPSDEVAKKIDLKIEAAAESLRAADEKLAGGAKTDSQKAAVGQSVVAKDNLAAAKQKVTEGDYRAALSLLEGVEDLVVEVSEQAEASEAEGASEPTGDVEGASSEEGAPTEEPAS